MKPFSRRLDVGGGYRPYNLATATVELKRCTRCRTFADAGPVDYWAPRLELHAAAHGARRAILETGA